MNPKLVYCFTAEGYESLRKERDALEKKRKDGVRTFAAEDVCLAKSSKHGDGDSPSRDEAARDVHTICERLKHLREWCAKAKIVPPPTQTDTLGIGHEAEVQLFEDEECEKPIGSPVTYFIAGYEETDLHPKKGEAPALSYMAPLIRHLLGKTAESDPVQVHMGGKVRYVILRAICLPQKRRRSVRQLAA